MSQIRACIVALAGAFVLFGASGAIAQDAAKGKEVFTANCASCHGPEGKGDGPAGAALNPKPADFSKSASDQATILKTITEGGAAVGKSPLMVAWKGTLNDAQIKDVTAFVLSLKK
jgi:cbb3-type cytochrome c oxidase subunit III